jgi:LysW-gamma-L-lysine carboxypeptidase
MSDYPIRLLTRLLEIYSPSCREGEISNFLAKEMKNLGFHSRKDTVGNVIGETGRGKPVILLCGHMDTVAGYIPVRVENNRLYGRGATDAKAALAAMVVASHTLPKEGLLNRIIVAGVVDEEGSGKGIKQLIKDRISPDYAVFGEPSGVDNIIVGYKGSLRLKITCNTQTGHSAAPWLFENAIENAFEIWRAIQKLRLPEEKRRSRFYSITSCLIKIKGGKLTSMVPSECEMYIDIRVPPQLTPNQAFDRVIQVVKKYQIDKPRVSVEAEIEDQCDAFEVDQSSLVVRALSLAIQRVRHKPVTLLRKTGTGDMNVLGKALGVPVVTYGPGNSHLDHAPNESIDIQEYLDSIQVYREAITQLLKLHKYRDYDRTTSGTETC